MINAKRQDFHKGFKTHYKALKSLGETKNDNSRRLILCYCVECGLKFLIMKNNGITEVKNNYETLKTHNIELLKQKAGLAGSYRFPEFKTRYGDTITPSTYHQQCRYCIPTDENNKMADFEDILKKMADVINRIC